MYIKKRNKAVRSEIEQAKRKTLSNSSTGANTWKMSSFKKFNIVCLSGASTINIIELNRGGKLNIKSNALQAPGKVIRYQDDAHFYLGTIMLIENGSKADGWRQDWHRDPLKRDPGSGFGKT